MLIKKGGRHTLHSEITPKDQYLNGGSCGRHRECGSRDAGGGGLHEMSSPSAVAQANDKIEGALPEESILDTEPITHYKSVTNYNNTTSF